MKHFEILAIIFFLVISLSKLSFAQGEIFQVFSQSGCNMYLSGNNGEAAVIDAGVEPSKLFAFVKKNNIKIKYIIVTHGHSDHVTFLAKIKSEYQSAPVLIHKYDAAALGILKTCKADQLLKGDEEITVGGTVFKFMHTPGHTGGSVCVLAGKKLFSGDTLFKGTIGRTDTKGGNYDKLISSLKNVLMKLEDDIVVYSGHGEHTTIGIERKTNPFLK